MASISVSPEEIINDLGGCGRYQVLLSVLVHVMKIVVCWSNSSLVFSMKIPTWWCVDGLDDWKQGQNSKDYFGNVSSHDQMFVNKSRLESCFLDNSTSCTKFYFDPYMKTLVTEFDLVCEWTWIPATIASVLMAGVFTGNFVSGQVADNIGRKKPFFFSLFLLAVCNILVFFSTSWVMVAVVMYFMGVGSGFFLTIQYNFLSEFTLSSWRSWIVGFPSWPIQLSLFSLIAWLVRDWRYIHLITGIMATLCLPAIL